MHGRTFQAKPDLNVTAVNFVNYDAFKPWMKIQHSTDLFFFFSLISTRLSRQKIPMPSWGGDLSCSRTAVQFQPSLNAKSETFPPYKKGVGEETDYRPGWSACGSLSSKYRDIRLPQLDTRFIFTSYIISRLTHICGKTIEATKSFPHILHFSIQ